MPDDAAWAEHVVVPDDIRELQLDVEAYHREQRALRRAQRWGWLTRSRVWQRYSFPLGVLTGALALSAVVLGSVAIGGAPSRVTRLPAAPLASPAHSPGTTGGLLPDIRLAGAPSGTGAATTATARALRPGIVVLVPMACQCNDVLAALSEQAGKVGVTLHVVAPADHDAEVSALPGQLRLSRSQTLRIWFDASAALASAYAAAGVTALVVDPDGIVSYVQRDTTVALAQTLPVQRLLLLPPYG